MVRQAQRREASRAAILAAAAASFGRRGFDHTTMDDVAAASGMAKGAVYHHFPSKQSLFAAVLDEVSAELAREAAAASRRKGDVLEAMVAGIRFYFRACASGSRARIVLRDGPAVLGWERWHEIDHRHFGGMIPRALERAMDEGLIARQPVEPLARLVLGAVTEATIACAGHANLSAAGKAYTGALASLIESQRVSGKESP